jgi:N-acetylneuraminic acid mutarotase|tara:strand:+ start:23 stop:412 length:390 start_codon:yes stop_codon:yes gene_type:complete
MSTSASCDRWGAATAPLDDGRFVVIGGGMRSQGGIYNDCTRSVESYDPRANRWQTLNPIPKAVWGACASASPTGVVVFGGTDTSGRSLRTVFTYDARADGWHTIASSAHSPRGIRSLEIGRWCASCCKF